MRFPKVGALGMFVSSMVEESANGMEQAMQQVPLMSLCRLERHCLRSSPPFPSEEQHAACSAHFLLLASFPYAGLLRGVLAAWSFSLISLRVCAGCGGSSVFPRSRTRVSLGVRSGCAACHCLF